MNDDLFRTKLKLAPAKELWSIHDSIVTIGSCFSDVMADQLKHNKFQVLGNPFGTIFNPISINRLIRGESPQEEHIVRRGSKFLHHDFHSSYSENSAKKLLAKLEELQKSFLGYLIDANWLIVTFGTANTYRLKTTGKVVANCHKVPQIQFDKVMLTQKEITVSFNNVMEYLKRVNPELNVLLTVSPVRHLKDGIEENSISKAILRTSCADLVEKYQNVHYFPSYEVMMDDLRDYRFYKRDMIHPNKTAEDYIWGMFVNHCLDEQTKVFIIEWSKIRAAIDHRPFDIDSDEHQKFVKATLRNLKSFSSLVDTSEEEHLLSNQLI